MCNVYKIATGKAGKIFAAFVVISVGIGFFTGKVSWGERLIHKEVRHRRA
jgi:type IV secretory pathway VirB2 component (pilin)